MTPPTNRPRPVAMTQDRWRRHPERWSSTEAADVATEAYFAAADTLARGDNDRPDYTESERLALTLAKYVGLILNFGPSLEDLKNLRDAVAMFEREPSLRQQRYLAVREVAFGAEKYLRCANDEGRLEALVGVATNLSSLSRPVDEEFSPFDELFGELNMVPLDPAPLRGLETLLKAYDPAPRGKAGKMGPETILAKLIVNDLDAQGAFGLAAKPSESDDDAVERIRQALVNAVEESFRQVPETKA